MRCKEFLDRLADLAEGGQDEAAALHVQGCPSCTQRVTELRALVAAVQTPQRDARKDLIARAKAIMPKRARRMARLLGSSLLGATRSVAEDFSLHVGADDLALHLRLQRTGAGWTVSGRVPEDGWSLIRSGEIIPCGPGGRFKFTAAGLEETPFILKKGDVEIDFPSAQALIASRTDNGS